MEDFKENMVSMCGIKVDPVKIGLLANFMNYLNEEPCGSLVALVTYMKIKHYSFPRKSSEQKGLLRKISDQEVVSFDDVLGLVNKLFNISFDSQVDCTSSGLNQAGLNQVHHGPSLPI